jgi:hypothetical protein
MRKLARAQNKAMPRIRNVQYRGKRLIMANKPETFAA